MSVTGGNAINNFPAQGAEPMSAGVRVRPGRAVLIDCTGSGTMTFTFFDDTTATINVQPSTLYQFNWAAVQYTTTGTVTVYKLY